MPSGQKVFLDTSNENECNWLSLIQPAVSRQEQNLIAFQLGSDIYYSTTRLVKASELLKVWYATGYARKLQKAEEPIAELSDRGNFYWLCMC